MLSPYLFNFYVEYIIQNAGLDDSQGGIKIARRNMNNLRYADDSTLIAESKEQLMNLSMKVKVQFSSVQSLSRVWLFTALWTAAHQASLSITNS